MKTLTLKVNEIFYSIQGEGARTGCPSLFIRLVGCNEVCGFCDTEFNSGCNKSVDDILTELSDYSCKTIVWTGGEPLLQLTEDIVQVFKDEGYYQCVETNGTITPPNNIDFISISPKVAEHVLAQRFPMHKDLESHRKNAHQIVELRYVRHAGQLAAPKPGIVADHYFISPMFNGDKVDHRNLMHCMRLILEDPKWNLSIQLHKMLRVL